MVASYVQLLERRHGAQLDAEAREYIGFALDGSRRMHALVNDLLAYSRIGRDEIPFEWVSLDEALEGALADLRLLIEENQATVQHDALPVAWGHPTQLRQLLQNLIANALKFRRDQAPHIRITASRAGPMWHVSVDDNGIGLDPSDQEKAFQIFGQLHRRDTYDGTGLGLAVCRRIVEHHDGQVWVEPPSDLGGARIVFSIPHRTPPAATETAAAVTSTLEERSRQLV